MENKKIVFKTKVFRKLPNPYANEKNAALKDPEMYELICDVIDIPKDIPMRTNPREQNLNTNVAKKIRKSLRNLSEKNFYLLNRGLVLSADSVVYDNKKDEVTIVFSDLSVHGNVDGGHTYKIICEEQKNLERDQQFVKVEVMTGVNDMFQDLAAARNTSTQVQDKSIAELLKKFDIIKDALKDTSYINDVYFKENDAGSIDVTDIIAILNMFNLERYPNKAKDVATVSYNAKSACITDYLKTYDKYKDNLTNPYVKMKNIIPKVFELYDRLEVRIGDYYRNAVKNGQYGRTIGVTTKKGDQGDFKSKFFKNDIKYSTPKGFIYPIIGAFRANINIDDNGYYAWKKDPIKLLDNIGGELVSSVVEISRELGNNPNATGKNKTIWQNLYMKVLMNIAD